MQHKINRTLAGVIAFLCVVGNLPANLGRGRFWSDTAIVANAIAPVTTEPVINNDLVYNGKEQALVTAGEVDSGKMQYAVQTAPTIFRDGTHKISELKAGDVIVIPSNGAITFNMDSQNFAARFDYSNAQGGGGDGLNQLKVQSGRYSVEAYVSNGSWALSSWTSEHNAIKVTSVSGNDYHLWFFTYNEDTYEIQPSNSAWQDDIPIKTEAGIYNVWYRVIDGENTLVAPFNLRNVEIAKASNSLTVDIDNWTYGDTAKTPYVTGDHTNGAICEYQKQGTDVWSTTVPTDAGSYTVKATVAESENYQAAEAFADFTISPQSIHTANVIISKESYDMDETPYTPEVNFVIIGNDLLTKGTDYIVSYENNSMIGEGIPAVIITGIGNYTGTVKKAFSIGTDLSSASVSVTGAFIYDGSEKTPLPVVTYNGSVIDADNYTVTYSDNINAGTAEVIITGNNEKGFTGSASAEFNIGKGSINSIEVIGTYEYTGEPIVPTENIIVKDVNDNVVAPSQYEVQFINNTNVGTAIVMVNAKNDSNYTGNKYSSFEIGHKYTKVEATAPTYEADGNIEYYTDETGTYYTKDGDTYTAVDSDSIIVPKLTMTPAMNVSSDGSKLNMNYYIPIADDYTLDNYSVTFGGIEQTLTGKTVSSVNYGMFTITCPAKEMADTKALVIFADNTEIYRNDNLSATSYLNGIITNYPDYADTAKSMLRYGAAAQTYFNYNTETLANTGIEGAELSTLTDIPDNSPTAAEYNTAFALTYSDYSAMNMTFTSDTTLLIAFKPKSGATAEQVTGELTEKFANDDYTISVDADNSGNYYIVKVQNIPIKKLGNAIFTFGEVEVKATDYLGRIANNTAKSENLRNLCKALYAFYQSATA